MGRTKFAANRRRQQLVQIAMDQIATEGFEGLRFQKVAQQAGINNATLFYYFPTKEALVQEVVTSLTNELKKPRHRSNNVPTSALEELHLEFADLRRLLRAQPKIFVVLIELSLRGLRDPVIGKRQRARDGYWREHLSGIVRRGIDQGTFRKNIDLKATVATLMAQMIGIGYHATMSKGKRSEADRAISELARQVEHWLVCTTI